MASTELNFEQGNRASEADRPANAWSLQRFGAAAGVIAVLLMIGLVVAAVPAFEGSFDFQGPAQRFGASVTANRQALGLAHFVIGLNGVLILCFTGTLRATLSRAEGEPRLLTNAAYSAGLLWAFMWILYAALVSSAVELPGFYQNPEGARTAFALAFHMALSPITLLLPAVLLGATALVSLRTKVLPRWLAWVSGVFALLNVVASALGSIIGAPAVILAILAPLWVAATSIMLLKNAQKTCCR